MSFSPASLSGLQNWYDASDPMGTGSAPSINTTISQWKDKSGLGNHTTDRSGDIQYKNDGSPYLHFPDSSDIVYGGSYYSIPPATWMSSDYINIFSVDTPSIIDGRPILGATGGSPSFTYGYCPNPLGFAVGTSGNGFNYINSSLINNTNIFSYTLTNTPGSSGQSFYHNGKLVASNGSTSFNSSNVIGSIGRVANDNQKYMGKMREIIIVKGLLSLLEVQKIEGYLATKWGLISQLPKSHSFYPGIKIPLNPATLSTVENWYDASDPMGTGSAPSTNTSITEWKDKSGKGNHTTGVIGNIQYKNDGTPYLDFPESATNYYSIPQTIWMNNTHFTIFTVENPYNINARNMILGANGAANNQSQFAYYNNANFAAGANSGVGGVNDSSFIINGRVNIICYRTTNEYNPFTQELYFNGRLIQRRTDSNEFVQENQYKFIGFSDFWKESDQVKYKGKIREIIMIKGIVAEDDRYRIEGHLATKWGLNAQLHMNHPYYQGAPPTVPTGVSATPGNGSATVSWTASGLNGGTAITNYIVTASNGATLTVGNVLTANFTGLTNGTALTFTVQAMNDTNTSAASAPSSAVTPVGVASAPTGVSATAGNGSATISWSAPSLNGGLTITGYIVTSSTGLTVTVGDVTTANFTGLANGTPLTFRVKAVNSAGNSPDSSESSSITPDISPNAPTDVSATPGNASALVSWSAPASNGSSAITNYIVTPSSGSAVTVGNVSNVTITGLTNGTAVTFTVVAKNNFGNSPSSSASSPVTPATVPGAPTGVSATAGNASAVVTWNAPTSEGGLSITGYIVTPSSGSAQTVGNVLTASFSGLTNGTALTFTVMAINSVGNSTASSASASVTPATTATAPRDVSATPGNESAVVTWNAPSSNGGAAVTGYIVTPSSGSAQTVGNVLTATFNGLANGTALTFTVVAVNNSGNSASSAPSLAVTPNVVPGAPTGVSAVAGNASAVVTWSAGSNNGTAVTNYIVTPSAGTPITVGNVLTASLTGLTNGSPVTFTVVAVNTLGNSAASSPSDAVTPATTPGTPTAVSATRGNASAVVTWSAPASNGGAAITAYVVTPSAGDPVTVGNVLTATFTGLTNGSPVTFTVLAVNALGNSATSAPSSAVTPATVPAAPTAVSATPGNTSAVVTWTAPASNGAAITGYIVTPSAGSAVTVGNVLTAAVTGLTNGSPVTFTVVAVNGVGNSPASSASSSVTPAAVPGAPTGVSATAGSSSAVVTWSAPASDGGSEVTGYIVTPSAGAALTVGNVLTANVTGLTNGTAVTFTVRAINNIGNSAPSDPSSSVTPISVPNAPTSVTAVAGTNSATVSWAAPASNGGAAITGYTVTPSTGLVVTVGNVLTTTLTGLASGTTLTFTVVAINSVGTSAPSSASPPIIPTPPVAGPPTAVLGVSGVAGVASATISWTPPISDGGSSITGYKVMCAPDNKKVNTAGPNATSLAITSLKNTVATSFTVLALNAVGQSNSVGLTSYPLPGVPKVTAARGASGAVNLTWTASPSNVASPITGYIVTLATPLSAPVGMVIPTPTVTATGGACIVSGLTNGTPYVFSVQSVSNIGQSAGGLSKPVIAATVPGVPTAFAGTRAVKSVGLTWVAPANTGGLPITGYTISYIMGGVQKAMLVKVVNTAIVKSLVDGTAYTFTIKATNLVGNSAESGSVTVTPGSGV